MVKPYTPACPLHSASANRLAAPSLRGTASHSTKSWLYAGSQMVDRAPHWHQDSRKSTHLLPQAKDTSFPTTPWLRRWSSCTYMLHLHVALCSLALLMQIVLTWFLLLWVCTLMVECTYWKSIWIKAWAERYVICNVINTGSNRSCKSHEARNDSAGTLSAGMWAVAAVEQILSVNLL